MSILSQFRVHFVGMYFAVIGSGWDSGGKYEGDFLHHIDIALSGRRQVLWQGEVIDVKPGSVHFWPGNTRVLRRCREHCEVLFLKFRCEWLPGVDPLLDWPQRRPLDLGRADPADWQPWADELRTVGSRDLLWLQGRLHLWLADIVGDLNALIETHLGTHARFAPAFQLVERDLGGDLRVEDLAAACGLSRDAFSRAFFRSTGLSPKEFLTRRINQEALQWVIDTDLTIKEIAHRLRFSDEFHFSRFFSKLNGEPPTLYRRRFRKP